MDLHLPSRAVRLRPLGRAGRALGVSLLLAAVVTASAPGWLTIRIHRGDTLSEIAQRYHTSVRALVQVNHLPGDGDLIYAGQTLRVPGAASTRAGTAAHAPRTVFVRYTVRPGDNVTVLGRRYGVSPATIIRHNHLPADGLIWIGQKLSIPTHQRTAAPKPAARHYPGTVTASAARHRAELAARSVPSRAATKRMIVRSAKIIGVDPSLALAVAWQESGFNQRRVSPADAIGVMQVLPSTGRWLSREVVGRQLDLLKAEDNIVAGVALLDLLSRVAPRDQAIAGYYQGLASVRSHGMYADTKAYVRNVLALQKRFAGR